MSVCVCVCECECVCVCVFVDIMYSVNVHENTQQLCTKYISIMYLHNIQTLALLVQAC